MPENFISYSIVSTHHHKDGHKEKARRKDCKLDCCLQDYSHADHAAEEGEKEQKDKECHMLTSWLSTHFQAPRLNAAARLGELGKRKTLLA